MHIKIIYTKKSNGQFQKAEAWQSCFVPYFGHGQDAIDRAVRLWEQASGNVALAWCLF
jgi:hypothetical protein